MKKHTNNFGSMSKNNFEIVTRIDIQTNFPLIKFSKSTQIP
jgi:hypothetical protein